MASGCGNCGTLHDDRTECPGAIPALGPERRGARVRVRTELGMETVRVLIAPAPGGWRARIMSDPNVLWTVPGGRTTLKFWGDSPQEVEQQAIAFIEERCTRKWSGGGPGSAFPGGAHLTSPRHPPWDAAFTSRKPARLFVRYGATRASSLGTTANLSGEGMFIASPRPLDAGTPLTIHLENQGSTIQVRGLVMWSRGRPGPGRPAGMGVRLVSPPPAYAGLLESLP